jgi:hypothetical protein
MLARRAALTPGGRGYKDEVSISAISPVGAAPPAPVYAPVVAPLALTANPPTAATTATSQLTGDAGELVQSYGAAALAHAMIAYPPIPISPPQPAVSAVAAVLPAGFTPIDTYA